MTLQGRLEAFATAVGAKFKAITPRLQPAGGTIGQVLAKNSATDFDFGFITPGTVRSVVLTQPISGFTITNSGASQSTNASSTFALADDLAAVEGLSTLGFVKRSATNTWTTQSAIALGDLGTIPALTILGNIGGSAASPAALTPTEVTSLLDIFTAGKKGLVPPAPAVPSGLFLTDYGTWVAAPTGSGGPSTPSEPTSAPQPIEWVPVTAIGTGSPQTINLTAALAADQIFVYVQGLLLDPTTEYTVSGAVLTLTAGLGDMITVRYLSSTAPVVSNDTTPNAFSFTDAPGVALGAVQTSNTITVAGLGIGIPTAVNISNGTYSKNGGTYTNASTSAVNGDTFSVRHTSSAQNSTAVNTILTIGGVSDTFTSTTSAAAVDATPNQFAFTDVTNVVASSVQTSNTITISGMTAGASAAVTITNGTYSKNGGAYTGAAGTASVGDTFSVRHTASAAGTANTDTTLTIGGISDTFTSTTAAAAQAGVPGIIMSSDVEMDHDDLAMFGVCVGMHQRNQVNILAWVADCRVPTGSAALRGVLNYSGLNHIPVGQWKGNTGGTGTTWANEVATMTGTGDLRMADFPDAVAVTRTAIINAPTNNNIIISGGSASVIAGFLQTPGDAADPRTGLQLAIDKVTRIGYMGGEMGTTTNEYNYGHDMAAAEYMLNNCPVPLFLVSGSETGNIVSGPAQSQDPALDPYRAGFLATKVNPGGAFMTATDKRASYDPTTLHYAVVGNSTGAYAYVRGTQARNPGTNGGIWTPSPTGPHYHLDVVASLASVGAVLDDLIAEAYVAPYVLPAPTGLVATDVQSTSFKINMAELSGATSYESSVNGGAWTALPRSRLIGGLQPSTANTIKLRGIRPGAVGTASADITVTTTAAAALWSPDELLASKKIARYRMEADAATIAGGTASQVNDLWGTRHMLQANTALQPVATNTAFNGEAPGFSASSDEMVAANALMGLTNNVFVFILLRYKGGNTNDGRVVSMARAGSADWDNGIIPMSIRANGTWWGSFFGASSADGTTPQTPIIVSSYLDNLTVAKRVNGLQISTATVTARNLANTARLGIFDNVQDVGTQEPAQVEMAELIICKDLTIAEVEKIEGYLAWRSRGTGNIKYNSLLNVNHPYKVAYPPAGS